MPTLTTIEATKETRYTNDKERFRACASDLMRILQALQTGDMQGDPSWQQMIFETLGSCGYGKEWVESAIKN